MMAGKLVSVFCVLFVVVTVSTAPVDEKQRKKVIDWHQECLDMHGVEVEVLVQALEGTVPDDDKFYEHIFCAAKKAKVMDDDGTVTVDLFEENMKDVIDPHNMARVSGIIRKCLIQRDSIMETIRNSVDCFYREEHGL
ncbi:uncharacterized protein LOC132696563 [Cylas formicarius]|uniref:Odorant binding protein 31 n=3 Tax=Neoptera TaxID=33340 RepID=A0A4Y5RGK4_NEZVI|nr:uncharacterized protein LOC132696563 [Cylas formicarius]QBI90150.1 odorant binding protein 8 [Cylas formicarius]QCZ25088.1 odorant binding protein 31 [Nezara viridula]